MKSYTLWHETNTSLGIVNQVLCRDGSLAIATNFAMKFSSVKEARQYFWANEMPVLGCFWFIKGPQGGTYSYGPNPIYRGN